MATEYTVKITINDATIEIAGDRDGIVEIVRELAVELRQRTPLALPPAPPKETTSEPGLESEEPTVEPPRTSDPRTFFGERKPSTHVENAVVAAYYLAELAPEDERSDTITTAQLQAVLRKAGRKLPTRPAQVLVDAHRAGYLDRAAHGRYAINNVGHNLVVHTLGD
jgi:hypothetical protein